MSFLSSLGDFFNGFFGKQADFIENVSEPFYVASERVDEALPSGINTFNQIMDLQRTLDSTSVESASEVSNSLGSSALDNFLHWLEGYIESPEAAAERQRDFNEAEADRAMQRARELRKTAASDYVEGLKAAGLNPVLAAGSGFNLSSNVAPQATSSAAQGTRAVDFVSALAALLQGVGGVLSGSGSLVHAMSPTAQLSEVLTEFSKSKNGGWSSTSYTWK